MNKQKYTILALGAFILVIILLSHKITSLENEKAVIDETISISPGKFQSFRYELHLPMPFTNARLKGHFIAQGGSGNDIIAIILNEKNYFNWINGYTANCLYNSGKIRADEFEINISDSQVLYVIFDNSFSTFSTKHVVVSIKHSLQIW